MAKLGTSNSLDCAGAVPRIAIITLSTPPASPPLSTPPSFLSPPLSSRLPPLRCRPLRTQSLCNTCTPSPRWGGGREQEEQGGGREQEEQGGGWEQEEQGGGWEQAEGVGGEPICWARAAPLLSHAHRHSGVALKGCCTPHLSARTAACLTDRWHPRRSHPLLYTSVFSRCVTPVTHYCTALLQYTLSHRCRPCPTSAAEG